MENGIWHAGAGGNPGTMPGGYKGHSPHQAVTGVTGIRKESPNLTVFPFAQPAAVLLFYSNRMYSFFYEAGIINRQHGTLMVQLGCQKLLADVKDCRLIQRSTCKELLHGLDRFLI